MSIGERVTQLRKECNVSQGKLAQALGVSRQAVSKWENDISTPDTLNLIKIADLLNSDVEYLATGKHASCKFDPEIITVEKIVEKPVVVEKIVKQEKIVEKIVEKPIIRKVFRVKYLRNPVEFMIVAAIGLILGILIGLLF